MQIKDMIALFLIASGLFVCVVAVVGVFRFNYVLNRMHATAMVDTLGLLLVTGGVALLYFTIFPAVKLLFVVAFLWLTSPVSAHLVSRVESLTNRNLSSHLRLPDEKSEGR